MKDRSLHSALPTSQTRSPAVPSSLVVGSESFLLQTSELGAVILQVAWVGGRWCDFFTLLPSLFLSEWNECVELLSIQQVGLVGAEGTPRAMGWGVLCVFVLEGGSGKQRKGSGGKEGCIV